MKAHFLIIQPKYGTSLARFSRDWFTFTRKASFTAMYVFDNAPIKVSTLLTVPLQLKPRNIFLDENENVKIGDFGLATTLHAVMRKAPSANALMETCHFTDKSFDLEEEDDSDMSKSSENVGTFFYTSPEGCRGPKCDIYSLGIILFEVSN